MIGDDILARVRSDLPGAPGVPTLSQYHYDGLGTTRALSGATGDATDATSYYGFGETLATSGATPNTLLFTGEQYDPNLGFYHLRARYYDPSSGRFASLDPFVGDPKTPMTLHKYAYSHNDGINRLDPSGLLSWGEMTTTQKIVAELTIGVAVIGFALGVKHLLTARKFQYLDDGSWSVITFSEDDPYYAMSPRTKSGNRGRTVRPRNLHALYDDLKQIASEAQAGDRIHIFGHGAGAGVIKVDDTLHYGQELLALKQADPQQWSFQPNLDLEVWTCHFLEDPGHENVKAWKQFFKGENNRIGGVYTGSGRLACRVMWQHGYYGIAGIEQNLWSAVNPPDDDAPWPWATEWIWVPTQ